MPDISLIAMIGPVPTSGITCSAYKASRFGTLPVAYDTAVPVGGADAAATSGNAFGGPGQVVLTVPTFEEYWISMPSGGHIAWVKSPAFLDIVPRSVTVPPSGGTNSPVLADGVTPTPSGVQFGAQYDWGGAWFNVLGGGVTGLGSADETAKLTNILASNRELAFPPGTYKISALSLAHMSGVKLRAMGGVGSATIAFTSTTGHVFDMTAASFCEIEGFLIRPNAAQKTAGEVFYLDNSGGPCQRNLFKRLQISSPFRGWTLNNCSTTDLEDIQFMDFNGAWSYDSGIALTAYAMSTNLKKIRGGTAAGITNALIYVPAGSGVDTLRGDDWDIGGLGGAAMAGLSINSGEWYEINGGYIESGSGTSDAIVLGGGKGIRLTDMHLLGYRGIFLNGGSAVSVRGGEILQCQRQCIEANANSTKFSIQGVHMSDGSQASPGAYDAVRVDANTSDFDIVGNSIASGLSGTPASFAFGVNIVAGTSDGYIVTSNRMRNCLSGGVSDNGTGTHKAVANNTNY